MKTLPPNDPLVALHPERFTKCEKCRQMHPLEYFQGVAKVELRYRCPMALGATFTIPFKGGIWGIPTTFSKAFLKRHPNCQQLQFVLMKR